MPQQIPSNYVFAPPSAPDGARVPIVTMDGGKIPGCMFFEAFWVTDVFYDPTVVSHDSDEVMCFIGSDKAHPDKLNCGVALKIENDQLIMQKTISVFIPCGTAHGELRFAGVKTPVLCCRWLIDSSFYSEASAKATAPERTYIRNHAAGYEPPSGVFPPAPEGFLTLLLYLDSIRIPGAPYLELMWMNQTNDTGPAPHTHAELDEIIGFLGTDSKHPDDLGATVIFYIDGKPTEITKSCLIHIPAGAEHGPLLIPEMKRPIIHFSCGRGSYTRETEIEDTNFYKPE